MRTLRLLLPTGRALLVLDVLLAAWVAFWVWLGVSVGHEVSGLRNLSQTVTKVGGAIEQTGATLQTIGSIPLVGDQLDATAGQIEEAGRSTIDSGRASRESVQSLSWMLALAVAVIPSLPILGFYVPLRVLDVRERRRLRTLALLHRDDPEFRRYLAHRALFTLPYTALDGGPPEPWCDYAEGRFDHLASAELQRLGVEPVAGSTRR
jgi:hypothetical protein